METYAILVPILIGLGEVLKGIFELNSKMIPVGLILLGLLLSFMVGGVNSLSVIGGLVSALMAMGLYSGGKATYLGLRSVVSKNSA